VSFRWYPWTADEYRPILLNRRALVPVVAVVGIALLCFVQDEEKGALMWQSLRMRPKGTCCRRTHGWSCLGTRGPEFSRRTDPTRILSATYRNSPTPQPEDEFARGVGKRESAEHIRSAYCWEIRIQG
jgi:hypothetical protein